MVDQQKLKQASKKQYQKVKGDRSNLQFVIKEFQESCREVLEFVCCVCERLFPKQECDIALYQKKSRSCH